MENVDAVATDYYEKKDIFKIRRMMKEAGIDVETPESPVSFAQLKKNADGLVPVIGMACRADLKHLCQQRVAVAVGRKRLDILEVSSPQKIPIRRRSNTKWLISCIT